MAERRSADAPASIRDRLPPWPRYAPDEIAAVEQVLLRGAGNYAFGDEGRGFEREFADWCGTAFALTVANGTLALELALRGIGVGPGDDVVVSPRSFVASASTVLLCGGRPVFADVDRDSGNLTEASIRAALTPSTRAIVVVHLGGWPCDMSAITSLARERGVAVVEDCAQAHGAAWRNRKVGTFGDAGAFSFCHDKIISTGGEGGMVVTASREIRDRMDAWRRHGRDPGPQTGAAEPYLYQYVHRGPGSNFRLTEMQSAIGRRQLTKVDAWLAERRRNAQLYASMLGAIPGLRCATPPADAAGAWYKYYFYVRPEMLRRGRDRDGILREAWSRGLPCYQGSCGELYRERVFAPAGAAGRDLPVAHELSETAMMFPVHPGIDPGLIAGICEQMRALMESAVR